MFSPSRVSRGRAQERVCLSGKLLLSLHLVGSLLFIEMGPRLGRSLGVKSKDSEQPYCVCPKAASVIS